MEKNSGIAPSLFRVTYNYVPTSLKKLSERYHDYDRTTFIYPVEQIIFNIIMYMLVVFPNNQNKTVVLDFLGAKFYINCYKAKTVFKNKNCFALPLHSSIQKFGLEKQKNCICKKTTRVKRIH